MPRFELVSAFRPTGDQPQAIQKLVEGVQNGYKHQTLLGATGTGKSLAHSDPVFIVEVCGDQQISRLVPIGELIDDLFENGQGLTTIEGDSQVLNVEDGAIRYFTQAFDPTTCAVALHPVKAFVRHETPAKMFHLRTHCGRSATLTGDHNLWVLRDGHLKLICTQDALPTDYLPLPEYLLGEGSCKAINTLEILKGKALYVEASQQVLAYQGQVGMGATYAALAASGVGTPYSKISAMRHKIRGRGIRVDTFQRLLDHTDNLNGQWNPHTVTIGGKLDADRLPAELMLTPELLALFGFYIAEGNRQPGYIIVSNHNPDVRAQIEAAFNQLGLPFAVRHNSDYQVSSTALAEIMGALCGKNARGKRLPDFWPQLDNTSLATLLRAYFDGDGTVERASAVTCMTASARLASDLQYALLRFGIWARCAPRWKRATNTDHAGDWYYQVTISGQGDLRRFAENIGFSIDYKQAALQRVRGHEEHSNVDVVPINGEELRWLRQSLGLSAKALGEAAGVSRAAIQFYELNQRAPRRLILTRILEALRGFAAERIDLPAEWHALWKHLQQLCTLRWTPISSVEEIPYDQPYVYDLCVPGVENFLAGNGGMFLHNTYVVAQIVEQLQRPTIVLAHNKTLAAQLYSEFKEFFPRNAVEYFVSYYDYYQPEAYVPRLDLYIEKESDINDDIERLRLAATAALLTRKDVLIVASVSCIYGLVSPQTWESVVLKLRVGQTLRRDQVLKHLVTILYERNDLEPRRGVFRVRGDTLEIMPSYMETAYRIALFGDEIERITHYDPMTGEILEELDHIDIFPAKHYVAEKETIAAAARDIEAELAERLAELEREGKLLEAQRLKQRTTFDLEMIREIGTCSGIENYSRHFDRRQPGSPPYTLLDYFPEDYLMVIDESHIAIPQVRGMYGGDRSRKLTLVDYGFRLPCALDNRPLNFEEFEARTGHLIYTTATPGPYELSHSQQIAQQVIRPTGIVDPEISIRPVQGQVDNLLKEVNERIKRGERTLVTTLTKRMAEDLSEYLAEMGIRVHYLHSEIDTIQRIEILRDLRLGVYDVVVGINLLREGLDLPEVSLVAILDADKEGFLRSEQALIQTIGRAARHINGHVIMYADKITDSMQRAIGETNRRRDIQRAHNEAHGIVPASIIKQVRDLTDRVKASQPAPEPGKAAHKPVEPAEMSKAELDKMVRELEKLMKQAAKDLEFEKAAALRDQMLELRKVMVLKNDKEDILAVSLSADAFSDEA